MPRVVHFEIQADEPERAAKFYSQVFDWEVNKWEGPIEYWLAKTGEEGQPGIDGAIMPRSGKGSVWLAVDVSSLEDFIRKVEEAGGKVIEGKQTVPGVGYTAYCEDTEGNIFSLFQADRSAQ